MDFFISEIFVEVIKIHNNVISNPSKRGMYKAIVVSSIWKDTSQISQSFIDLTVTETRGVFLKEKKMNLLAVIVH